MKIVKTIDALRSEIKNQRLQGKIIGFVPTMGNLHDGHISLIDCAKQRSDFVICSIFVNPTQFGAGEDLDRYPRTLAQDEALLVERKTDLLFLPDVESMYPHDEKTRVSVNDLSNLHCGAARPGHFEGVTTIVTKLFNLVQPDIAVFGSKDFQQLAIIRRMVIDLMMPIDIIGAPTMRNEKGLALSSRNGFLSEEELEMAPGIYQTLQWAKEQILADQNPSLVEKDALAKLTQLGFKPDYFHIADAKSLHSLTHDHENVVILAAAHLGGARLIDNIHFSRT